MKTPKKAVKAVMPMSEASRADIMKNVDEVRSQVTILVAIAKGLQASNVTMNASLTTANAKITELTAKVGDFDAVNAAIASLGSELKAKIAEFPTA
jgi:hypothetical protein